MLKIAAAIAAKRSIHRTAPLFALELGKNFSRERAPTFDETVAFAEALAASRWVATLVVRPIPGSNDRFEIICGERRFRALTYLSEHGRAFVDDIPIEVFDADDKQAAVLNAAENIRRDDLSLWEQIRSVRELVMVHCFTLAEVAKHLGKSESQIKRFVHIAYRVHPEILLSLRNGEAIPLTKLAHWATLMHDQQLAEWRREPTPRVWEAPHVRTRKEIQEAIAWLEQLGAKREATWSSQSVAIAWLRWVIREGERPE